MLRHLLSGIRLHLTCLVCESDAQPSQARLARLTLPGCVYTCICVWKLLHPIFECNQSSTEDVCVSLKPSVCLSWRQTWIEASFPQNVRESDCWSFEELTETLHSNL